MTGLFVLVEGEDRVRKCQRCFGESDDEVTMCRHCGELLAGAAALDIREPCTECGSQVPASRGFCPKCGVIQLRRVSGRDALACPNCRSSQVERISAAKKAGYVAVLGILAPAFKSVRSQFKCNACGNKW